MIGPKELNFSWLNAGHPGLVIKRLNEDRCGNSVSRLFPKRRHDCGHYSAE